MSLNELINFAKGHNIDFDKDILCIAQFDGECEIDNLEQIAMTETDEGNKLVFIPLVYSYNTDKEKELGLCDTVNSCKK